jgi:hypothetical protein
MTDKTFIVNDQPTDTDALADTVVIDSVTRTF